jgi:hypothetical protein
VPKGVTLPAIGGVAGHAAWQSRFDERRPDKAVVEEFDDLDMGTEISADWTTSARQTWGTMRAPGAKPGIEGTRTSRAPRNAHLARWLESQVVVEGDMVVQFGVRMTG